MITRWIYDIEIYPNLFLLVAKNVFNGTIRKFQVSQYQDDRQLLQEWLSIEVTEMVGFNNLFYDYPVLHNAVTKLWSEKGSVFCNQCYKFSKELIGGKRSYIKDDEYYFKQIDLFKINHYDNKARITSLKLLEFNLRLENIQELPYKFDIVLTKEQIDIVVDYCVNDVLATELLYKETLSEINLREKLSPVYSIDFTNYNSAKLGEHIFIQKLIKSLGEEVVYDIIETDSLYAILCIVQNMLLKLNITCFLKDNLIDLINVNPQIELNRSGFTPNWKEEKIWQ